MNIELNSRLISRNDTTANWTANKSVVLLKGEIGVEFLADGSLKIKIGDGTTTWENLEYFNDAIKISGDGKSIVVSTVGEVSLLGFADAETGAQPRKKADGTIEWVKPDTTTVEGLQTAISGLQSDVSSLESTVELKANTSDVYTKDEVDNRLSSVYRYKGSYPDLATLEQMIPESQRENGDVYNIVTGGGYDHWNEKIKYGDNIAWNAEVSGWDILGGATDLSGLATPDDIGNAIEQFYQDSTLVSEVKINGVALENTNKTVNIPIAGSNLGVVLSSDSENEVKVTSDGKMQLNNVNVNKLAISTGDTLILNGGSAN